MKLAHACSSIVALLLGATLACSKPEPAPNVLILLIDALRADHLGCYGYERDTSPHIDALAAEGLRFEKAYAQSPWTKPSIPSLFTSLYPIQHGVYEGETHGVGDALESDVLPGRFTTLAEAFGQAGYRTAGFVHNAHLQAQLGFAQGFDVYEQSSMAAPEINQRFLEFAALDRDRPFFAYLHYLDVHWPFQPEEPFRSRFGPVGDKSLFSRESWHGLRKAINNKTVELSEQDLHELRARHDAGIAQLDAEIGKLLAELRQRGWYDRTVILLTSDHGEELLDHGEVGHGGTLFREVIDIPFIMRIPGLAAAIATKPARLLDAFPTLLDAAGLEIPPGLEGLSLLASGEDEVEIVAETRHRRRYRVSVRDGSWKLIRSYRDPGPSLRRPTKGRFGLAPGLRVKIKGSFDQQGTLHAEKVTAKDSSDDDLEISGPISQIDERAETFEVEGLQVDAEDLLDANGSKLLPTLTLGEWIKVEGDPVPGRRLEADKLVRLREDDRSIELEGIVQFAESLPDDALLLRIGDSPVRVTRKTRIKGLKTTSAQANEFEERANPFAPDRLLEPEGLEVEHQLYDLASDPRELVDLASERSERVQEIGKKLDGWLARAASETDPAPVERREIDEQTIDQLRELGYLE